MAQVLRIITVVCNHVWAVCQGVRYPSYIYMYIPFYTICSSTSLHVRTMYICMYIYTYILCNYDIIFVYIAITIDYGCVCVYNYM
jgi:hypothetical protein